MKKSIVLSIGIVSISLLSCSSDDSSASNNENLNTTLEVLGTAGNQIIISKYNPERIGNIKFDTIFKGTDDNSYPFVNVIVGDSIKISSKISDPINYDITYRLTINGNAKFGSGSLANWGTVNFKVKE